jgi:hypothetical protein
LLLGVPILANIVDFSLSVGVSLADLEGELQVLLTEVNRLLPQLNTFITQFNNLVLEAGINVVTDASGTLSIDVPATMDDTIAQQSLSAVGSFRPIPSFKYKTKLFATFFQGKIL